MPNFSIFREDRSDKSCFGGSAIFVHNSLTVTKLDWFKNTESVAVNVRFSNKKSMEIICVYRSPNLTKQENNKLLSQLEKVPFTSPDFPNIIMVGDFNLPNVDWTKGIVVGPVDTIDQKLILQN